MNREASNSPEPHANQTPWVVMTPPQPSNSVGLLIVAVLAGMLAGALFVSTVLWPSAADAEVPTEVGTAVVVETDTHENPRRASFEANDRHIVITETASTRCKASIGGGEICRAAGESYSLEADR